MSPSWPLVSHYRPSQYPSSNDHRVNVKDCVCIERSFIVKRSDFSLSRWATSLCMTWPPRDQLVVDFHCDHNQPLQSAALRTTWSPHVAMCLVFLSSRTPFSPQLQNPVIIFPFAFDWRASWLHASENNAHALHEAIWQGDQRKGHRKKAVMTGRHHLLALCLIFVVVVFMSDCRAQCMLFVFLFFVGVSNVCVSFRRGLSTNIRICLRDDPASGIFMICTSSGNGVYL